ncbi:class I SAM-dependent DNA methyltransferase [Agrococcus sediminis]|uniref:site-specific DNA-methyltransferase (adenine-specific) n=1 Tax=Agrococcus sediminis TaxID=2599924 RepID=A0A5M8QPH2_9MICO|nr:DNA methyltransferase [Agrococcus sediminis]KAA6436443.1 class I SAM-dependent DNA methyltransferase [Agrococcus sediminis]
MKAVSAEMRQAATEFASKWAGQSGEKQLAQSYWTDFFHHIIGVPDLLAAGVDFEKPVRTETGSTGFIDVLWGGVVLIEHKSAGKSLDVAEAQARGYLKVLPAPLRAPFIVVSNFATIRIVDVALNTSIEFPLSELPNNLDRVVAVFGDYSARATRLEITADRKAGEKMARLYQAFEEAGYSGHEVSVFLVRLLFLLFGDDTSMWRKPKAFEDLVMAQPADGSTLGAMVAGLFQHLNDPNPPKNTPAAYLPFPYVNGGLFAENIRLFHFTDAMRDALVDACSYDWSSISPAIFGAMFQTVKSKEERRKLGEHYTSEANILKVIRPLFLDDFTERAMKAWDKPADLRKLRTELGKKRFLDPACGSGNFLLVAYRHLRELELKIIVRVQELTGKTEAVALDGTAEAAVLVSLEQFHGFEYEEWSSQIATVAMFLADRQANLAMEEILGTSPDRFPLKESAHIHNLNALRTDWSALVPMDDDTYIFGNPPFYGFTWLSDEQRADQALVWNKVRSYGDLDYVASWFLLAAKNLQGTRGRAAFVTTSSLTQGQQPPILWGQLYPMGFGIDFAHRSFLWANAGGDEASVYVAIVGFSANPKPARRPLWSYETARGNPTLVMVPRINAYLLDAVERLITSRSKPLAPSTQTLDYGSKPTDGGLLSNLMPDEAAQIRATDPIAAKYLRRVVGAKEFIYDIERWGLWLLDASPADIKNSPTLHSRVSEVKKLRLASTKLKTQQDADRASEWQEIRQHDGNYIAVPLTTSANRRYIPMGYLPPEVIANNKVSVVRDGSLLTFGVLSSRLFVVWTHGFSGRLKNDPNISGGITYNNFPFPTDGHEKIATAAQAVLDARAAYPDSNLAALYDDISMPPSLRKAHAALDKAVLNAYGMKSNVSEVGMLETLFSLYVEAIDGLLAAPAKKSRTKKLMNVGS